MLLVITIALTIRAVGILLVNGFVVISAATVFCPLRGDYSENASIMKGQTSFSYRHHLILWTVTLFLKKLQLKQKK